MTDLERAYAALSAKQSIYSRYWNYYDGIQPVVYTAKRLEEIFEPLHQLDGSPTRRYGGTGLGLALVKLIVGAHGSQIRVESELGKGTSLSFLLPVADQPA